MFDRHGSSPKSLSPSFEWRIAETDLSETASTERQYDSIFGDRAGECTYYETIGGGFGVRPDKDGMDGGKLG